MVGKNQIKLITGLRQKKFRVQAGLFIAEGAKVIGELLTAGFTLEHLYITDDLFASVAPVKKTLVSDAGLKKITALTTPNNCLALFKIPAQKPVADSGLSVALDDVRDPGNLGTIVRLCDWFGVRQLLCSNETADLYNPKVVQATMGSMARVNVVYLDLPEFLSTSKRQVFGTFMDGRNIYSQKLPANGIIVLGNEANGISPAVEKFCSDRIAIPRFGDLQQAESLNVATAAAIVLSEFRR